MLSRRALRGSCFSPHQQVQSVEAEVHEYSGKSFVQRPQPSLAMSRLWLQDLQLLRPVPGKNLVNVEHREEKCHTMKAEGNVLMDGGRGMKRTVVEYDGHLVGSPEKPVFDQTEQKPRKSV